MHLRKSLGIFSEPGLYLPLMLIVFGFLLLATQTTPLDSYSHLTGFVLGAGFMGLLYNQVYRLVAKGPKASHE